MSGIRETEARDEYLLKKEMKGEGDCGAAVKILARDNISPRSLAFPGGYRSPKQETEQRSCKTLRQPNVIK